MDPIMDDPPSFGERATAETVNATASAPTVHPQSPPPAAPSAPAAVHPEGATLDDAGFAARYQVRAMLGRGGMGEVRLCHDGRIGREVAMKLIHRGHGSAPTARLRFLREARVQGQLEHPAVVPVYDLGISPEGEIYFTMKRIRGVSLEQVLHRLRAGDEEAARKYTRHRLLTAISSICLAVDFAHQRGVLHRDLKPANLMLGDFGEVHVLDWGLARVAGDAPGADAAGGQGGVELPLSDSGHTVAGQILGTPGYMAPEQVRGAIEELSPRTDVYALGAILYEVLTLAPLHRGGNVEAVLRSTLLGADARPVSREGEPEVPPELAALCVEATSLVPDERLPSARAMHEAVERYLAGDRDLALRRDLAATHAQRAAEAAARALAGGQAAEAARSEALQEVGRALALDPRSEVATRTFLELLARPPAEVPAEVRAALARSTQQATRLADRAAGFAVLSVLPVMALMLWMGVRSWLVLAAQVACVAVLAGLGFANARGRGGRLLRYLVPGVAFGALLLDSRIAGPYVLVPALAGLVAIAFAQQPDRAMRLLGIAASVAGPVVAAVLEAVGWLPASYRFAGGEMVVLPQMLSLPPVPTQLFLLLGTVWVVLAGAVYITYLRAALEQAEQRFQVQHWQLRQMVPASKQRSLQ